MAKDINSIEIYIQADGLGNFQSVQIAYGAQDDVDTELKKTKTLDFSPDTGQLNSINGLIAAVVADVNQEEGIS